MGKGVFDFFHGDKYDGEFKNGLMHGLGVLSK